MRFECYASSSSGNVYTVDDGKDRLLIECGKPYNKLKALLDYDFTRIIACLISHEHKDHSRSAKELIDAGIPIYASYGTIQALNIKGEVCEAEQELRLGDYRILPFSTYHDAAEPLGYYIKNGEDKLVFATDTTNIPYNFPKATIIAVECNYIRQILDGSEHLPDKVKKRIKMSHFELDNVVRWLYKQDLSQCREIHLMHLSDACSDEEAILRRMQSEFSGMDIKICAKTKGADNGKTVKGRC